jgi:hypothetical protein
MVSLVYEFGENEILKMHELIDEYASIMTYSPSYHNKMVTDINILRDAFVEYVRESSMKFACKMIKTLLDEDSTAEEKEEADANITELFHYMFDFLEDDDKA